MPKAGCKDCKDKSTDEISMAIHTTCSFCSPVMSAAQGLGFWRGAGVAITPSLKHVDSSVSFQAVVASSPLRVL